MSERKQVILFMTDTTRKDMLGCYGDSRMITPNLDRLAQEGIRYENAYSCQPVCGPARGAIFTGMFPHSNGVSTNSMPLGEGVKTIGQRTDRPADPLRLHWQMASGWWRLFRLWKMSGRLGSGVLV